MASRPRAERLITDHGVRVDGVEIRKAGKKVRPDATLELLGQDFPWVSRGALKLLAALDHYGLDPGGRTVLDLGASTGGFTEVCLHRGAAFVHAVDVGTDQLAPALREDPRVADLQQTHLKDLDSAQLDPRPDVVVIDLSFISSDHVWPRLKEWVAPTGWGVAPVKPQFEVGRNTSGATASSGIPTFATRPFAIAWPKPMPPDSPAPNPSTAPSKAEVATANSSSTSRGEAGAEPLLRTAVPESRWCPIPSPERVRPDFPILSREVHGKPLVYLDNAASAQKPLAVIEGQKEYLSNYHANIHRAHHLAALATEAYEGASQNRKPHWRHCGGGSPVCRGIH